jgi:hypothetical protein
MEKPLSEVAVGSIFTVNGIEYVKTDDVRISCCKSVNCYAVSDSSQKTYLAPNTVVSVNV